MRSIVIRAIQEPWCLLLPLPPSRSTSNSTACTAITMAGSTAAAQARTRRRHASWRPAAACGSTRTGWARSAPPTSTALPPQGWLASSSTGTAVIRYTYSNTGDITQISMGDGNWIKYRHDNARRVVGITNRLGESVDYTLDAQGNRTRIQIKSSTGAAVNTQQYVYDELGRLLRSLGAAGQTHQFGDDLNDNLVSATSPRNHKTQHSFDALNRLVQSVDPLGAITRINYDPNDRPTQVMEEGEWKVGPKPGIHPTSGAKITVSAGGKIIKINK